MMSQEQTQPCPQEVLRILLNSDFMPSPIMIRETHSNWKPWRHPKWFPNISLLSMAAQPWICPGDPYLTLHPSAPSLSLDDTAVSCDSWPSFQASTWLQE